MRRSTDQIVYAIDDILVGSHVYQAGELVDVGSYERAKKLADADPAVCYAVCDAVWWSTQIAHVDEVCPEQGHELRDLFHAIKYRAWIEKSDDWQVVANSLIPCPPAPPLPEEELE